MDGGGMEGEWNGGMGGEAQHSPSPIKDGGGGMGGEAIHGWDGISIRCNKI